jgi:peptidoglycan/LPS O-acetylase OafA/YrhL
VGQDEKMPQHIKELDGLRAVLALWVFGFHILAISGAWTRLPSQLQPFLDGAHAVDVFIILSGFVICGLVVRDGEGYRTYITRRFLRLYPAYVVCLIAALVAQAVDLMPTNYTKEYFAQHLIAHLTMLHGAIPASVLPGSSGALLNPAWSISLEWQFYLVAPLLIGKGTFARFAAATAICLIAHRFASRALTDFDGAFLPQKLHLFWIGIAYALALNSPLATKPVVKFGSIAAFLFCLMFLPYQPHVGLLIWTFTLALVMCRSTPLLWQPLQAIGLWSYSVYLTHEVVVYVAASAVGNIQSDIVRAGAVAALSIPAVLFFSYLLYNWVEKPFISLGRAMIGAKRLAPLPG